MAEEEPSQNTSTDFDRAVEGYRKLRDHKEKIQKRHKEELAPINEKLATLENWMLAHLNLINAKSVKTNHGTVYISRHTSSKVVDWDATLQHIIDNELWHMLERRVSRNAVEEYVESQGTNPPGVQMETESRVNVRRS